MCQVVQDFFHQPLGCALTRGDLWCVKIGVDCCVVSGQRVCASVLWWRPRRWPPPSGEGSSGLRRPGHLSSQIALFCSSFLRET